MTGNTILTADVYALQGVVLIVYAVAGGGNDVRKLYESGV